MEHLDDRIVCGACGQPIPRTDWAQARVWSDPDGIAAAAHDHCLAHYAEIADNLFGGWVGL
jgi:hypothetical protein